MGRARDYAAIPIETIMTEFGYPRAAWSMWCFTGKSRKGEMCLFVRLRTGAGPRAPRAPRARPDPAQPTLAEACA